MSSPIEYGCLVFGILSSIASLLVLIAILLLGFLILCGYGILVTPVSVSYHDYGFSSLLIGEFSQVPSRLLGLGGALITIIILVVCIPFVIAFIFSVTLCKGICQKKPGKVKAYFIYGVVVLVISTISAIVHMALHINEVYPGAVLLFSCIIYGLILWMVHVTYRKISKGVVYNGVAINTGTAKAP